MRWTPILCTVVVMLSGVAGLCNVASGSTHDQIFPWNLESSVIDQPENGMIWLVWYQDPNLSNSPSYTWDATNWTFSVWIDQPSNKLCWDLWHKTNPHEGETTADHCTGSLANAWQVDGSYYGGTANHPGCGHVDEYTIDLTADGNRQHVTVTGVHTIPEPATLSLLALGGLALIRRKRT